MKEKAQHKVNTDEDEIFIQTEIGMKLVRMEDGENTGGIKNIIQIFCSLCETRKWKSQNR